MILQSLVNYYEILTEDPESEIPLLGYCRVKVSYALSLSQEGDLKSIIPLKILDNKGKKYVPISMVVPEQEKKSSGVKANFLCENSSYVFGIDNKGKPDRSIECFEAFKNLTQLVLQNVSCDEAVALKKYVNQWNPEHALDNPILKSYLEDIISGANFVFQLDTKPGYYFQDSQSIRDAWEKYKNETSSDNVRQCLVSGRRSGIARLHPSLKGIRGGQAMGNSLVSFNAPAYESYGNEKAQGLNAPVSEYATFAYAAVLNYLLNDHVHKFTLGDATVVFWAESPNRGFKDCMSMLMDPGELEEIDRGEQKYVRDTSAVREIKNVFEKISNGMDARISNDLFDEKTKVYILGLSPNAARISIRFFIQDSFGSFVANIAKHYKDMSIEKQFGNEPNAIPIWRLLYETVSPKSNDKSASPLLAGATLRAILQGMPYPELLYNAVLIRIRAEKTINYYKAAIIKAYLIRNYEKKDYGEVLRMALNEDCDKKAYVLGRLFAVLEKVQEEANPGINTTIKDRYFTSACATPANAFPTLLRLSNHHIAKAEYGYASENRIKALMDKLDVENNPFPKNLSLDDQGLFILGYYQQTNNFYKKFEKEN